MGEDVVHYITHENRITKPFLQVFCAKLQLFYEKAYPALTFYKLLDDGEILRNLMRDDKGSHKR